MINNGRLRIALGLLALNSLFGCATSPWHENLMSNDQLVAANCEQLAAEQRRVSDNAQHAAQASSGGATGAVLLGVLEGMAAVATKTPMNTSNSAAMNSASLADEHSKQAAQLEGRKNMIEMLRGKKGCSIGTASAPAQPRLNPEIANCEGLKDGAARTQIGSCGAHIGCRMILNLQDSCTNARVFLGKLNYVLAGRREITNNDVFEAHSPALMPSPVLISQVATVQSIVRNAANGPANEKKEYKSTVGQQIYYEGELKDRNLHGVGVAIFGNGTMLRGQFENDSLGGQGQTVTVGRAVFSGSYRGGQRSGNGVWQISDGVVGVGTWNMDKLVGMWDYTKPSGTTYKVLFGADGKELARGPEAPPGQIAQLPGASPPAAIAAVPGPASVVRVTGKGDDPAQGKIAGGSAPDKPAVAEPAKGKGGYPKITANDLAACKNELAEFHRLEISFLKKDALDYCTKGKANYDSDNCKIANQGVKDSADKSHLTWFMKGNGSCDASDYPCFGLSIFNDEQPPEEILRSLATDPLQPSSGERSLWDYAMVVDKCIAKLWVAKLDRNRPAPAHAKQAADKPTGGSTPALAQGIIDTEALATKPEYMACRSAIERSCFAPSKCEYQGQKEPCMHVVNCDLFKVGKDKDGNDVTAYLGGYSGGGPSGWEIGTILSADDYAGFRSDTWEEAMSNRNAINICRERYAAQGFIDRFGNAAEKAAMTTIKTVTAPTTAGGSRLSPKQIAACSEDIRRTQLASQSWPGDANAVAARLGRFQKDLFEGRCAGHPEAKAYLAGANKMLGYGENATEGGGSKPPLAFPGNSSGSGSKDPSRTRKVHNPTADAKGCVQLIQDTTRQGAEISGRFRFANKCATAVELFWCSDAECTHNSGNTWTIHVGGGWPVTGTTIRWGACRGRNSGGFDKGSQGQKYTCPNLTW